MSFYDIKAFDKLTAHDAREYIRVQARRAKLPLSVIEKHISKTTFTDMTLLISPDHLVVIV